MLYPYNMYHLSGYNLMKREYQKLAMQQIDKRLLAFRSIENLVIPQKGWINAVRTALGMSLRQLGERLQITQQSVKEIEEREVSGSITLNSLNAAAHALQMQVVYGLVPLGEDLESIIEKRAQEIAEKIVMRTSASMKLEGQENSPDRLQKAIIEKADELKRTMPRYFWD
jgi:predicted DNA-binding mobile mystery protein A